MGYTGELEPFDALSLYVRCINKLIVPLEEHEHTPFSIDWSKYYAKFSLYINLVNLKFEAINEYNAKGLPRHEQEDSDVVYKKRLEPIVEKT